MKFALITTTINTPYNLEAYVKDIADHNPSDTLVIVAGDLKTPEDVSAFCEKLTKQFGISVRYLSPVDQQCKYPDYSNFLGWNTIQRRNIALLEAYKTGAEIIVTIDDDNYLTEENYLEQHGILDERTIVEVVDSDSGWYNNCRRLRCENAVSEFYPRGYSLRERGTAPRIKSELIPVRSVVNAGLWVGDPDIDAVTRIAVNPKVNNAVTLPFALGPSTYCPFNSQNTAIHRDALSAYCMVSGVGRYDDIISSFFVKRIADHFNDAIRFGAPIVRQERNPHNLWKDLDNERIGMCLTDSFVDWLKLTTLQGRNYRTCMEELLSQFTSMWVNHGGLSIKEIEFMRAIRNSYEAWGEVLCN